MITCILRSGVLAGAALALAGCCERPVAAHREAPRKVSNCASIALPTGDRDHSVLLLEKCGPTETRVGAPTEYTVKVTNLTSDVVLENVVIIDKGSAQFRIDNAETGTPAQKRTSSATPLNDARMQAHTVAQEQSPKPRENRDRARDAAPDHKAQNEDAHKTIDSTDRPARAADEHQADRGRHHDRHDEHMDRPDMGAGPEARFMVGRLNPRESRTITVRGVATATGQIFNCASATYDMYACLGTRVIQPELRVSARAPDADLCIDDTVNLTMMVANTGTGATENVVVDAQYPADVTPAGGERTSFRVGRLGAGEHKEISTRVRVAKPGTYVVHVTAHADQGLTATAPDVTINARKAALTVVLEGPAREHVGLPIEYRVRVTNTSKFPAPHTVLTAQIPAELEIVDVAKEGRSGDHRLSWNVGTLEPGQNVVVSFRVRSMRTPGDIQLNAMASAECTDDARASIRTALQGVAAMVVEVVDKFDPHRVGEDEDYVITVHNQGSADETNVTVVATVPDEMDFVSASGATQASAEGRVIRFRPLARLAPKDTASWHVITKCRRLGDVRFKTDVTSDMHKAPVTETESTVIFGTEPVATEPPARKETPKP